MRQRVLAIVRPVSFAWLLAAAALLAVSALSAQTFRAPQLPVANDLARPVEAAPAAISSLLEKGRTLETDGHWADALSHYEEALHEHPEDPALKDRFDVARLHYSFEQRYDDQSFCASVRALRPRQGLEHYGDLLSKISAHYYTEPPWQELTQRGVRAMDLALAKEQFLRTNGVRAQGDQVSQLRVDMLRLASRYAIRSSNDALAVAVQIARLADARIGLNETATYLEFTAAAAGGLDHYSAYLTPDQFRDIYSQIEGNFVGLGVELKADKGSLLIVHVIPSSPAEAAGIRENDHIIAVDGQATQEMSTDEAASMLTGEEGSLVRVTVVTPSQAPRTLTIRRTEIDVPSLEDVKIIEPATGVAYLRIPAFQKTTARDLEAALWDLHRQGMRSLVIDLRGNPGGLLTASVEIADKFIANGPLVSTRGRSEQENFNYAAHRPGTWRVPLVVLIDGDSASASEIFAGAIQDAHRGKIVGARSYGKGSVQGIFPLGTSGAGLRLTTAKFYSPNGNPISNVGITPDIDTRRATAVAAGGKPNTSGTPQVSSSADAAHLVGYRGTDSGIAPNAANGAAATNFNAAAAEAVAAPATTDATLDIAIGVARNEPVAAM